MSPRDQVAYIVRAFEGGDADHPDDRGGRTRFGLTFAVFVEERPGATLEHFLALTRDEIVDLLCERYALKPGYWRIAHHTLRLAVIDYAIHSHWRHATQALQRVLGVTADGSFGPQTAAAVNAANPEQVRRQLVAYRLRLWSRIFRRDRTQLVFAGGWLNRAATLLEAA